MADSNAFNLIGKSIKRILLPWALPRFAELQPGEWEETLQRARDTTFDMIERVGVLACIAFVTYLLRFETNQVEEISLPVRYFIQFLAAVPLLILLAGPFYLRCLRRGLNQEIKRRLIADQFDP